MHSLLFIFLKFDRANIFAVKKLFQRLSWKITRSLKINYYDIMVVIDTSLLKFILTRIWQRGCKGVTRGFARGGSPQAGREGWSLLLNVRPSFLTLYLLFLFAVVTVVRTSMSLSLLTAKEAKHEEVEDTDLTRPLWFVFFLQQKVYT